MYKQITIKAGFTLRIIFNGFRVFNAFDVLKCAILDSALEVLWEILLIVL